MIFAGAWAPSRDQWSLYVTVDLNGNYNLSSHVSIGLQIANLFDDPHWEAFGGDILRRRALTSLKYSW